MTKNPNPINNHNGFKPLSFREKELIFKEKHLAGFLQAAIEAYKSCPNTNERVDKLKGCVQKLLQRPEEDAADPSQKEPIPIEQQKSSSWNALEKTRNTSERNGGWGSACEETRGSMTARAEQREKELEEARQEAKRANEKAAQEMTTVSQPHE